MHCYITFFVIGMDIFSKNTMNFILLRWYQLILSLMDYNSFVKCVWPAKQKSDYFA